jgi:hypothetical protein
MSMFSIIWFRMTVCVGGLFIIYTLKIVFWIAHKLRVRKFTRNTIKKLFFSRNLFFFHSDIEHTETWSGIIRNNLKFNIENLFKFFIIYYIWQNTPVWTSDKSRVKKTNTGMFWVHWILLHQLLCFIEI